MMSMLLPFGHTAFANSDVLSLQDGNGFSTTEQAISTTGSAIVLDKSPTGSKKPVFSANAKSELEKPIEYETGQLVTLPDGSNFYREGYRFVGWNTDPDADSGFFEIVMKDDTVLYAIWVKDIGKSTTESSLIYKEQKPSIVTESSLQYEHNNGSVSTEKVLSTIAY